MQHVLDQPNPLKKCVRQIGWSESCDLLKRNRARGVRSLQGAVERFSFPPRIGEDCLHGRSYLTLVSSHLPYFRGSLKPTSGLRSKTWRCRFLWPQNCRRLSCWTRHKSKQWSAGPKRPWTSMKHSPRTFHELRSPL
jgi:hypothetical protein